MERGGFHLPHPLPPCDLKAEAVSIDIQSVFPILLPAGESDFFQSVHSLFRGGPLKEVFVEFAVNGFIAFGNVLCVGLATEICSRDKPGELFLSGIGIDNVTSTRKNVIHRDALSVLSSVVCVLDELGKLLLAGLVIGVGLGLGDQRIERNGSARLLGAAGIRLHSIFCGGNSLLSCPRPLIPLHGVHGHSVEQIHDVLGVAQSAVHILLHGVGCGLVIGNHLSKGFFDLRHKLFQLIKDALEEGAVLLCQHFHKFAVGKHVSHSVGHDLAGGRFIAHAVILLFPDQSVHIRAVLLHVVEYGLTEFIIQHRTPFFIKMCKFMAKSSEHDVLRELVGVHAAHQTAVQIEIDLVGALLEFTLVHGKHTVFGL